MGLGETEPTPLETRPTTHPQFCSGPSACLTPPTYLERFAHGEVWGWSTGACSALLCSAHLTLLLSLAGQSGISSYALTPLPSRSAVWAEQAGVQKQPFFQRPGLTQWLVAMEEIFRKGRSISWGSQTWWGPVEPQRELGAMHTGEQQLLPELGACLEPWGASSQRAHPSPPS